MPISAQGVQAVINKMKAIQTRDQQRASVSVQVAGLNRANEMKNNRPWTDRTGDARRSIHAEFNASGNVLSTSFGIGVFYGIFLEKSNGGKYRIVVPTWLGNRQIFLREIAQGLKR